MSTSVEAKFAVAKDSISWAEEAIAEFDGVARAFFQPDAAHRLTEFDPDTGENVLKVRLVKPLPKALRRKATEALLSLKHSFDQATFAARTLTSGMSDKSVYYPWASGPADLIGRLKRYGIDERLWDVFAAHEPYRRSDGYAGGDDLIRTLATMANQKHTVGLAVSGEANAWEGGGIGSRGYIDRMMLLSPRWDAVKNEIELVRWVGDLHMRDGQTVYFKVLLKDARLPNGTVAKTALEAFSAKAHSVVESLQARCIDLRA